MKIKILRVYEKSGSLVVETECKYGKNSFGCSLNSRYIDPETDKPKYIGEITKHLRNRYEKEMIKEKDVDKKMWGKEISI